jgi:hypothetical protein
MSSLYGTMPMQRVSPWLAPPGIRAGAERARVHPSVRLRPATAGESVESLMRVPPPRGNDLPKMIAHAPAPDARAASRAAHTDGPARRRDAHCTECGYGVAIFREPLRCPMCGGTLWVNDLPVVVRSSRP